MRILNVTLECIRDKDASIARFDTLSEIGEEKEEMYYFIVVISFFIK